MRTSLSRIASPGVLFYLLLFAGQAATGFFLALDLTPSPAFSLLYGLGFLWGIGWWVRRDGRRRGVGWVLDMGLFLYLAWPFFMPYYLFRTRGARGLWHVLIFAAVYAAGLVAGAALFALLA